MTRRVPENDPTFAPFMRQKLERFPIRWNHLIEKESLKFKELEHVLIEKVNQLFRSEHALKPRDLRKLQLPAMHMHAPELRAAMQLRKDFSWI